MNDFPYEDIIKLPRHKSKTRKPMPLLNRAAQFAPFAALTGYHDAVKEAARLTDRKIELDEYAMAELDRKLFFINEHIDEQPVVKITYFLPDKTKDGGKYIDITGVIKRIKNFEHTVVMMNSVEIPIANILFIESSIFDTLDDMS